MSTRLVFSSALAILLCFTTQSKADWVMDFGPGLSGDITTFSFTEDPPTGPGMTPGVLTENHTSGHQWVVDGKPGDPVRTANIRYEFSSLFNKIKGVAGADPNTLVQFSVPLASNANEGTFFIVGTAERASGQTYTFTDDSGGTPGDPNGDFEWRTSLSMADIASDDIIALNFDISFDYTGVVLAGLDQTFTFGGPGGLVAAPEPTSAAMIGCALVGLIARRRRRA